MKLLLSLILLSSIWASGQDVAEEMTVHYRELRLHVLDEKGEPVHHLNASDLLVMLDKTPLEIEYFEEVDFNQEWQGNMSQDQEDHRKRSVTQPCPTVEYRTGSLSGRTQQIF